MQDMFCAFPPICLYTELPKKKQGKQCMHKRNIEATRLTIVAVETQ